MEELISKLIKESNISTTKKLKFYEFRNLLFADMLYYDKIFLKSPIGNKESISKQRDILGDTFVYERNLSYKRTEEIYSKFLLDIPGIKKETLIYNSGMSAIISVINTYIEGNKNRKINILYINGYFEVDKYFKKMNFPVGVYKANTEDELIETIKKEKIDLLYIEPITYSEDMKVLDIEKIVEVFNRYASLNFPLGIIIDTTLTSIFTIKIEKIFQKINKENIYVTLVQSMIKLHQFGLELLSFGIVYMMYKKREVFFEYVKKLEENRSIYSVNLKLMDIRLLTNSFLQNEILLKRYINQIFKNNEYVAQKIKNKKFRKVYYPSIINNNFSYSKAPFIIIKLIIDKEDKYDEIINKINNITKSSNIEFYYGSSFGFIHSRYEKIIYKQKNEENMCFIKISIGYESKYLDNISNILNSI